MIRRWQDPDVQEGRRLESERRRKAFEAFMRVHRLKPSDWARAAGLPNANTIYAYRKGTTDFLSQSTLQQLISAVPGATLAELLGEVQQPTMAIRLLPVRAEARVGLWQQDVRARVLREMEFPLPADMHADELVRLADDHADRYYPPRSYLALQHLSTMPRPLRIGDRVIVHAISSRGHEITCREIGGSEETPELFFSTHARTEIRQVRLPLPAWPYDGRMWEHDGVRYVVLGRVIMMMVFEEARYS